MIEFNYEADFFLENKSDYTYWLTRVLESEGKLTGDISYIFCTDIYLHALNQKFLNHDSFTDILTFDYSEGNTISGDVFISIERVMDNANSLKEPFERELNRVMVHGLLHMMGYGDKTEEEKSRMRKLEEDKMLMFHVEQ
ncbi:rRNA maturation RNase YbeY [Muriicola sp. Z0-33]|uniref:rRNA maturation RNase YbeY n=1 Tax=Muriicola sp. Z0-33 TaxID=2816957 RepID=UPI002238CBAA|nr:rRNA maturation RNase YbeY [Muriicola sp. Z0-33]MCW5514672.1 rRNA maturation RNase YbeY [Muriicola sp. Z0-33]